MPTTLTQSGKQVLHISRTIHYNRLTNFFIHNINNNKMKIFLINNWWYRSKQTTPSIQYTGEFLHIYIIIKYFYLLPNSTGRVTCPLQSIRRSWYVSCIVLQLITDIFIHTSAQTLSQKYNNRIKSTLLF